MMKYDLIAQLVSEVAARWASPLESQNAPADAVSFVMIGRNTFEDRGRAYEIGRLFTRATGVICLAHVANVESGTRILTVESANREWHSCASDCIGMLADGLHRIDQSEANADCEAGL